MLIKKIKALKEVNSRKENTIKVIIETNQKFEASAPGGASRGKYEARPFSSKGTAFSINLINVLGSKIIKNKIKFNSFSDLAKVEELVKDFDKTKDLKNIGANAVYALEAAIIKAIANSHSMELWQFLNPHPDILPRSLGNCIGGGLHIKALKKADIQEFLLLPLTKYFFDAYFINLQLYKEVKRLLPEIDKGWQDSLTDENALATTLDTETILDLLTKVKTNIKKEFGFDVALGVDFAASTLWDNSHYIYKNPAKKLNPSKQISYVLDLIKKYQLFYVEDPLQEEDFIGFARLLEHVKSRGLNTLIVGDDLICTQQDRLKKAIKEKSINGVIIKPNQNGSLIETKKIVDEAKKNNIIPIISHRSGETLDETIADLAVGWRIPIIKTGILGEERFAKLHRLLRIERQILKDDIQRRR